MPFTLRLPVLRLVYERIREVARRLAPKQTLLTQPADLERIEEATQEAPPTSVKTAPLVEYCVVAVEDGKKPVVPQDELPQKEQGDALLRAHALADERGFTHVVIETLGGVYAREVGAVYNPPPESDSRSVWRQRYTWRSMASGLSPTREPDPLPDWRQRYEQWFDNLCIEWSTRERQFWIVRQVGSEDFVDDGNFVCFEPGTSPEQILKFLRTYADVEREYRHLGPDIKFKAVEIDPQVPEEEQPWNRFAVLAPEGADGADDTSEEEASAEEDEGDAADNEVEREIERLRAETKEKEGDDDSVEGGAENGSDADNETGENQTIAFEIEDVLSQISEQTDRAELAAMVEKYPALKKLVEAGEQLEALRPRLRALGGEQAADKYENEMWRPIAELERFREWKEKHLPLHVQEKENLRNALVEAQARIAEMEGTSGAEVARGLLRDDFVRRGFLVRPSNQEGRETERVSQIGESDWDGTPYEGPTWSNVIAVPLGYRSGTTSDWEHGARYEEPLEGGLSIEWSTCWRHFWIVRQVESGSEDFVDDGIALWLEVGAGREAVLKRLRPYAEIARERHKQPGIRFKAIEVDPRAPEEQHPTIRFAVSPPPGEGTGADAADDEQGSNQEGRAFSDMLGQISEENDRTQLQEMAEKYPALKKLVEAGEQLEALRPRLRALADRYENDPSLPITELEEWRKWKANDWPKYQQEEQNLRAEARIAEMGGTVLMGTISIPKKLRFEARIAIGAEPEPEPPPPPPKLARCVQCEHVFLKSVTGDSPIACEQCGANLAWQFVVPVCSQGSDTCASRPKLDVAQLRFFTGQSFEQFLKILFQNMGFSVKETPSTMDQGADLILTDSSGRRIGVQAKRYNQDVGNTAVQEVLGGMAYWGCSTGIVVSASGFTKAARDLASKVPTVLLWDKRVLEVLINAYMRQVVVFVAEKQPASGAPGTQEITG